MSIYWMMGDNFVTMPFSAWSVNNLIFTIFALQEVSFQQWLKRTSLNETIFDAWTSV